MWYCKNVAVKPDTISFLLLCVIFFVSITSFVTSIFLGVRNFRNVKCSAGTFSKVITWSDFHATDSFAFYRWLHCASSLTEHVGIVFYFKLKLNKTTCSSPFLRVSWSIFSSVEHIKNRNFINDSVRFRWCPFSISVKSFLKITDGARSLFISQHS